MKEERHWWKEAVVYQIYPRSFQDSNGDGIGDLRGIISRLNYVKSLGVDVIWLNPVYASPNDDNGYDISNYREIMSEFGTMEDFDELLKEVHARGMRLVLDMVVNHTSDEHPWFREARKSRNNPYYSYYHWWPQEKEQPPYRPSYFEKSAWQYNPPTRSWYLHYFSRKQPDLNWENPEVRREIYEMMHFWFRKGIDGFRMDSISLISKDMKFPPVNRKKYPDLFSSYAHGPHLHDYLHEMNRVVWSCYDSMTVGEGSAVTAEEVEKFVSPERGELNMLYGFGPSEVRNYTSADSKESGLDYSLIALKRMFTQWDKAVGKGWPSVYLGNHDQPRMVSRFGNDAPEFRSVSAKMLATFLLTLRGTPYWFAGDELGMVNPGFEHITDYRDIATLNQYAVLKDKEEKKYFLKMQKEVSRDNARTPMQWDRSLYAGFSSVTPWIGVNPDYVRVNACVQERDPASVLNYFREMVAFRKANPELIYGSYVLMDEANKEIYAYWRKGEDRQFLITLNFTAHSACLSLPPGGHQGEIVMHNYGDFPKLTREIILRPYEALVIHCS